MGLSFTRDFDKLLHHCRNRVHLVGVELEGGWRRRREDVIRDGSVHMDEPPDEVIRAANAYPQTARCLKILEEYEKNRPRSIGELPSKPMTVKDMPLWVRENYPEFVNQTCGLHIHMSFRLPYHYMLLMRGDFQDVVVDYVRRWAEKKDLEPTHPIWPRLRGESTYCQLKYLGDAQAALGRKHYERDAPVHRYTAINYSWGTHGTIECRLLPMFPSADLGIEALQEIIAITNAFLVSEARKEEMHEALIIPDGTDEGIQVYQESV